MDFKRICITGGAGFIGSTLALRLKAAYPSCDVTALDSLYRRGSELNLPSLEAGGVRFVRGDVAHAETWTAPEPFDLLIDCAADPSVHAGLDGATQPVLQTGVVGTMHALETARRNDAAFLYFSTSRVYPIEPINALPFAETETRFTWQPNPAITGWSGAGVAENFPLDGARSLYGAAKLASEILVQEYAARFGIPALNLRCGVVAGPRQMGKADQGIVAYWAGAHVFQMPLRYTGFGGMGKQVRDVLHVEDVCDLVTTLVEAPNSWHGQAWNAGGGIENMVSLNELTELCREHTGVDLDIGCDPVTSPVDIRIYSGDNGRVTAETGWRPQRSVEQTVKDTVRWLRDEQDALETYWRS